MTSIFNTYYGQNLARLNSSLKEETSAKKVEPPRAGKTNFARVLADLETPHRGSEQVTKETKTPPLPPLTNIVEVETPEKIVEPKMANIPAIEPENISLRKGLADPSLHGASYFNVNFVPEQKQSQAPEILASPLPPATAPSAPRIAEINREEPIAPSTPRLASVERLPDLNPEVDKIVSEKEALKDIITTAGKFYGIDPNLGMAIAQAESSFEPMAVSKDGHASKGIFQLLDTTGRHMMGHTGVEDEVYDPFDPAQNAYLGVGYLRRLHDIFSAETHLGGNMRTVAAGSAEQLEKLAVAAFNTGEGNVARAQARARALGKDPSQFDSIEPHLPASTRRYVQKVSQLRQAFAAKNSDTETV